MKRLVSNPAATISVLLLAVSLVALSCAQPAPPTPTAKPAAQPTAAAPAAKPTAQPTAVAPAAKPAAQPTPAAPAAKPAAQPTPVAAAPAKVTSIKAVHIGATSDAGKYIALEKGYFKEEGLDVELVLFSNIAQSLAPVAAGQIEVGKGAVGPGLINAIARGIPVKIVADDAAISPERARRFQSNGLVARKDLVDSGALKDFSDLKGKKVATLAPDHPTIMYVEMALKKGGLTLNDIEMVHLSFPDVTAALANKAIDVAFQVEPFVVAAEQQGIGVMWKGAAEFIPNQQVAVVTYGPEFAKEKSDLARRFMVAYVRGIRDYYKAFIEDKDKTEVIGILAKHTPIKDPAMYTKMATHYVNPDGYVDVDEIMKIQDWFVARGTLQQKVDGKDLIDYQFIEYALQRLGKYK